LFLLLESFHTKIYVPSFPKRNFELNLNRPFFVVLCIIFYLFIFSFLPFFNFWQKCAAKICQKKSSQDDLRLWPYTAINKQNLKKTNKQNLIFSETIVGCREKKTNFVFAVNLFYWVDQKSCDADLYFRIIAKLSLAQSPCMYYALFTRKQDSQWSKNLLSIVKM